MLAGFHTTVATFPGTVLDRLSSFGPLAELNRRRFSADLQSVTQTWPWLEVGRMAAAKAGLSGLVTHETGVFCIDSVYRNLDKRVASGLARASARTSVDAVYAYEDGAENSFRQAKQLGIKSFYDLPIGYWRAAQHLLDPERERWPEWASTLTGFNDSQAKLARKDEELRLADRIIVASRFTADTLRYFPGKLAPIDVIPYGFPEVGAEREFTGIAAGRPLKLLFVGGLSQRKGIADLFAAVEALQPHVELTVIGRKTAADCPALDAALSRHRWIPSLPHADILKQMRAHDVLVFPSLFEGFGLVITEAMSQGTPVITTERTAGPEVIEHGHNGWLVNAGSTASLQAAIEELLHNPSVVAKAGRAAMETARRRTWSVYGQELAMALTR
jgi:glycosyltransferase involved in cell wall biosynthesis